MDKDLVNNNMETRQGISDDDDDNQSEVTTNVLNNYQPHTVNFSSRTSRRRRLFLPAYPFHKLDTRPPLLLLANVANIDRNLMSILSYNGDNSSAQFPYCPFKFVFNLQHEFLPSFLIDFYQKLYLETSERWKISQFLIDYNLVRLQQCMERYSKQVGEAALASIDELPMALEFYLQIDGKIEDHQNITYLFFILVDLFFMKTCTFRESQPRRLIRQNNEQEGLLCEIEPRARYGMMSCGNRQCFLCQSIKSKSSSVVIEFSDKQIHRFINGYQAILNCSAV